MFGLVRSEASRRCLAVAVRAWRGGRRFEGPGVMIGWMKRG
jgi:hypothetical protein